MSLPTSRQPTNNYTATVDGELLKGSSGHDKLTAFGKPGSGTGTLSGGAGDDTYVVWATRHRVIESAGEGIDTVQSHWTYTLPEHVENLILVGRGPNSATGNELDNIITGNANKNIIDGGAGDDVMTGGGGNDTFFISGKDTITDFSVGDHVNIQNFKNFTSFSQVKAAMTQVGADTLLKLSASDSVLFKNTRIAEFTDDSFVYGLPANNYKLVFADDFDTLNLNLGTGSTDNWHPLYPRSGLAGHTVIGRSVQYFTYLGDEGTAGAPVGINPFSLKDGILTITMDRVAPEDQWKVYGYDYTSGNITSIGSFHQTYGYFEIRAKLAAGAGLHDAFWMLPMDGSWPPELDIVEQRGSDPTRVINGVHSGESTTSAAFLVPTATTEFHVYGLDWQPDFLTYYIDGVPVRTIATPAGLDVPMYMLANLGGGSDWAGSPTAATPFPAKMEIDYIRAYASESTLEKGVPFNKVGTSGDDVMYGTPLGDTLNGGLGDDKLYGGAGDDRLIGGGGKDLLDGGFGDDTYVVSSGQERISEGGRKGHDTVETALSSFTLGLNLEDLIYTGIRSFNGGGNSENNKIVGGDYGNTLSGHAGNDTLIGGAGVDTLYGGEGDDILYAYAGNDTLRGHGGNDQLFGGDGHDRLVGGDGNDVLNGGRGDDHLQGEAGNDTLIGGDGNDRLDGGSGVDSMAGGAGDDSYVVDDPGDTIIELAGGGNDSVRVLASSYVMSAHLETMTYGGSEDFTGTGSDQANRITGGAGNDVLDGAGGADTLTGGAGNDRFVFARGQADGDRVTDFTGAGVAGGDLLVFTGFGNGTITRVGNSDFYVIKADAARGGTTETIQLSGVTNLAAGDYRFEGATSTNSAPTNITASNLSVRENASIGTTIGILSATDPDAGDTATFNLLDNAGGRFRLSGAELVLVGSLDHGAASSHTIKVRATDSAGNSYTRELTVSVTKVAVSDTLMGTAGEDSFIYDKSLPYKRVDGLGGSDTLTVDASKVSVAAKGAEVTIDVGANRSVDLTAVNVENLVLNGSEVTLSALGSTALAFGEVKINGTGGNDVLDAESAGVRVVISGGDGADTIKGSSEADQLDGGAGADKLYANGGADILRGGEGNDTYYLDNLSQVVVEAAGEGVDRVVIAQDYTLGDNVEDLTFAGTRGHIGNGNALANNLVGSLGDDVLDGKGGADTLTGDRGEDRFLFSAGEADGDTVTDFEGAGAKGGDLLVFTGYGNGTLTRVGNSDYYVIKADAARGSITETIRLAGVTNLSSGDYQFVGSDSANSAPTGISASNLSVSERAANGTVIGVLSSIDPDENDTATFRLTDDAGGRFILDGNQLLLAAPLDFESSPSHGIRIQAMDSAGNTYTRWLTVTVTAAANDTRYGSSGDDSFVYSSGLAYNRIDGRGGVDTLSLTAASVSVWGEDGDVAIDLESNGSVDFSTRNVEKLIISGSNVAFIDDLKTTDLKNGEITITGTGEADNLDASLSGVRVVIDGGAGRDVIRGGHAADTLVGGADADKLYAQGAGDVLFGGAGNDTYYLDDPTQVVVENPSDGTDRIVVKFDYTLEENFEDLTFAGSQGHVGTGNAHNNRMVGSYGDDTLYGLDGDDVLIGERGADLLVGGRGSDTLTGGEGADTFRFTERDSSADFDTITDFERGVDRIELAKSAFGALSRGSLDPAEFARGAAAETADQHLIYDQRSGALYYDADGAGGQAQVQIALILGRPWLTPDDIFVI